MCVFLSKMTLCKSFRNDGTQLEECTLFRKGPLLVFALSLGTSTWQARPGPCHVRRCVAFSSLPFLLRRETDGSGIQMFENMMTQRIRDPRCMLPLLISIGENSNRQAGPKSSQLVYSWIQKTMKQEGNWLCIQDD